MAGMRAPTNSLRLTSWNFSTVHKHVRENWVVLIHLLGGSQVPTKSYLHVLHPQSPEHFQGWGFHHAVAGSHLDIFSRKDGHQKIVQSKR